MKEGPFNSTFNQRKQPLPEHGRAGQRMKRMDLGGERVSGEQPAQGRTGVLKETPSLWSHWGFCAPV